MNKKVSAILRAVLSAGNHGQGARACRAIGQSLILPIVVATLAAMAADAANAATFTWDASGNHAGSPTDGAGTWSTTGTNWSNGSTDAGWNNANLTDNAVIGVANGAAGTITVGAVSVGNITFNAPGSGSYTLTSGTITLTSGTITTNAASATINSVIAGSVGLTVNGAGTLNLGGVNTYAGGTTLAAGTLSFTNASALSSGTITLSGGTLFGSGGGANAVSNNVVVTANTTTTLEGGGGGGFMGFTGSITGSGTIQSALNAGDNIRFSGNDSGFTGTFIVQTGGFVFLNAANSASAAAAWQNNGTMALGASGTYNFGSLAGTGVVDVGTVLSVGALNQNTAFSGTIVSSGGTASLTVTGTGSLTLTGANIYAGATTVTSGTLQIGNGSTGSLSNSSALTVSTGTATLAFDEANGASQTQNIADAGTVAGVEGSGITNTLSGVISGAGAFTQSGSGTTVLSGSNSFNGGLTVSNGTLAIASINNAGANGVLGNNSSVTLGSSGNTGTLEYTGSNTASSTMAFALATSGTGAFRVDGAAGNLTLSGTVGGSGALLKTGTGTLTLSANNTYTGSTTVSAGTLEFAAETSLYSGSTGSWTAANINVASGATLAFAVGSSPQFTASDIGTLAALGTGSSGFESGAILGLDTTNAGGSFTYGSALANPNGGSNVLGLNKLGAGTLILTASNTYSGATTITSGTLQIGGAGSLGASLNYAGAITDSGAFVYNSTANETLSGIIGGTGSLTQSGANTLTVSNASNSYSGGTTLSSGTLSLGSVNALGSGTLTLSGGALLSALGTATPNNVAVTPSTTTTLEGNPAGGGAFLQLSGSITGSGTIQTDTIGDNIRFSGNNSGFSGTFIQQAGNGGVYLNSANSASAAAAWQINSTIVLAVSGTYNFGSLSGGSGGLFDSDTVLSVGALNQNTTFNGTIVNSGGTASLTKVGTGSLTLTGVNTYTGTTTISSGTLQLGAGSTTGKLSTSSAIVDNGTLTINRSNPVAQGTDFTAAAITGGGGLIQAGTGITTLNGTDSYTGVTTVQAGTLEFATETSLYSGSTSSWTASNIVVNSGATLALAVGSSPQFTSSDVGTLAALGTGTSGFESGAILGIDTTNAGGNFTNSSVIANPNGNSNILSLSKLGSGTLILTASNTYTGATTINSGTLQIGNGGTTGSILSTSGVTGSSGATLVYNRSDSISPGYTISGGIALTQAGAGTVILTASNTYTGATTINSGTLQIGNSGTTGSIASTSGISGSSGGTLVFNRSNAITITSSTPISGGIAVTQAGGGTLTLSNANTYSGGTTLSAGTLSIGSATAMGSGTLTLSGGTLLEVLGLTIANNVAVTPSTTTTIQGGAGGAFLQLSGTITGSGTIQSALNAGDNIRFSGNDSGFTGTFIVQTGGFVFLIGANSASAGAAWQDNGTMSLSSTGTFGFGSLSGSNSGASISTVSGEVLSIGALNQNTTYSGAISGGGSLTEVGTGTSTLTGANSYTGGSTINAGATLQIGNGGATGSLPSTGAIVDNGNLVYNLNSAATITLAGSNISGIGSISGTAVNIVLSGTIAVGGSQSYTEVGGGSGGQGISLAASGTTTLIGSSISLNGDVGNGALALNTSASNGPISLNVSLGRSGVFSAPASVVANSGTGTISIVGSGPISNGWSCPVTLTGVVNISAPVIDTSTLTINPATATASSASGALSGGMSLVVGGPGTLALTASNTYSGSTRVNAGTLQIGNGGTTGSIGSTSGVSGSSGGTLAFDRSDSVAWSKATSGGMGITQAGSGTLTLSGASLTYTGPTTATSGTLIVSSALGGAVVANGGTLTVNSSGSAVSGTALSGKLIVAGGISGNIAANGGTLLVNNSGVVSGNGSVAGGTLGGAGNILGNVTVGTGSGSVGSSIIYPSAAGGTVGTILNVGGNLTLSGSDAAYEFKLNADQSFNSDSLAVTGTLTLGAGATLTGFNVGVGTSVLDIGNQFEIASAANIVGTFSNAPLTGSNVLIGVDDYSITYAGTEIDLTLTSIPEPGTVGTLVCGFVMLIGLQRRRGGGRGQWGFGGWASRRARFK